MTIRVRSIRAGNHPEIELLKPSGNPAQLNKCLIPTACDAVQRILNNLFNSTLTSRVQRSDRPAEPAERSAPSRWRQVSVCGCASDCVNCTARDVSVVRCVFVCHFLRKVERGRSQDLAPRMNEKYFGGRETGSRPHIVEGFGSCFHNNREYIGGRETGSQPRNEVVFWPFPKREVKLCQSVFSRRMACLCHADSEGM